MADKVVDASAVVALLFNELARDQVASRLRGASLFAPILLPFEVASACLKKMRASPDERTVLLQAFAFFGRLSITWQPVDLSETIALAARSELSLYDASYLWLANALDAELVTLDDKLARAARNFGSSA